MENKMTMNYELITPEIAQELLETNTENRKISRGTVEAYATRIYSEELSEDDTMNVTLFGLKIDRAINDPDCVEIWKNITHKFI